MPWNLNPCWAGKTAWSPAGRWRGLLRVYVCPWRTPEEREEHGPLQGPAFRSHWWLSALPYSQLLCAFHLCDYAPVISSCTQTLVSGVDKREHMLGTKSVQQMLATECRPCVFRTMPFLLNILSRQLEISHPCPWQCLWGVSGSASPSLSYCNWSNQENRILSLCVHKNKKDISRHLVADRFLSFLKKTGVRMIEERLVNFCQLDTAIVIWEEES